MTKAKPSVLVVDDDPDSQSALAEALRGDVTLRVRHPQDVDARDLRTAHLVLVDFRLDEWGERDASPGLSLQPIDGVALAAVLRSHSGRQKSRPTAFALYSGHLEDLADGIPLETREHAIARVRDLEWAFSKQDKSVPSLRGRVLSLASAVQSLPSSWPPEEEDVAKLVRKLMRLSRTRKWNDRAWEEMLLCHPPIWELAKASSGLSFLRWLLHRILPYRCFLWDAHRVAQRLRVSVEALENVLRPDSVLWKELDGCRYAGILSSFFPPMWWGAGVDDFLWTRLEAGLLDRDRVARFLAEEFNLASLDVEYEPVAALDHKYLPLPELVDPSECVRIQPDDWPPYSDPAWTTIELARRHGQLQAIVVEADRNRLRDQS